MKRHMIAIFALITAMSLCACGKSQDIGNSQVEIQSEISEAEAISSSKKSSLTVSEQTSEEIGKTESKTASVTASTISVNTTNATSYKPQTALSTIVTTKMSQPTTTSAKIPDGAVSIALGKQTSISGKGAAVSGNIITITSAGLYYISGTLDNGMININATGKVYVYLAGVNITNSNGPALCCEDAKRVEITLAENTVNYLTDGGNEGENNAAIFANDTLEINGSGTLYVKGNNREGIASDDDIIINSGNIYITSNDDGLNANDDITVNGGCVYIKAGGDGIDSKGTTNITGGNIYAQAVGTKESAIESDGSLTISGGTLVALGESVLPSSGSLQYTVIVKFTKLKSKGSLAEILNGANVIADITAESDFEAITFNSSELKKGKSYDVVINNVKAGSFAISDKVTIIEI